MNTRKIVKKLIPNEVFRKIEPYGHLTEAILFNAVYKFPLRGLKVIGVTGTNGKTTTCYLIHRMLQDAGYTCGLMTTVAWGVGEDIKPQKHHMTTVSVPVLLKRITAMKKHKMDFLILETTSHALAQNRVWGVPYYLAVMTNLTHEHLSYHGTMERYREAKVKMFKMTSRNRYGLQTGIINADDPNASYFKAASKHVVTYSLTKGDIIATNINLKNDLSQFDVQTKKEHYHITCYIPGSFNVSNSLAAIGVGEALGLTKSQIEQGIGALKSVEGRMTKIDLGQSFDLIVDYAHSPDSFEKLFKDLKEFKYKRVIVLFGSLGGGDLAKRPLQGELAGKYANIIVLCEEDDRLEDGQKIMDNIAEGVYRAGKHLDQDLFMVHDRSAAIRFAISQAKKGDLVLLLGKGHEKTIEHADGEHPWNEIKEATKALKEHLSLS